MKQYEKDLQKIIDLIDNSKELPIESDIQEKISRDSFNLLLVRGLIDRKKFKDMPNAKARQIYVTPYGYSYFLERKCLKKDYIRQTLIALGISALSGFATSALFQFFT